MLVNLNNLKYINDEYYPKCHRCKRICKLRVKQYEYINKTENVEMDYKVYCLFFGFIDHVCLDCLEETIKLAVRE